MLDRICADLAVKWSACEQNVCTNFKKCPVIILKLTAYKASFSPVMSWKYVWKSPAPMLRRHVKFKLINLRQHNATDSTLT